MLKIWKYQIIIIIILSGIAPFSQAIASDTISCANLEKYPYTADNEFTGPDGFCAEVLALAAEEAGIAVDFVTGTNGQLLRMLTEGELDCIPFMSDSRFNRELFQLSPLTLLTIWGKVVSAEGNNAFFDEKSVGRRVGFLLGDICAKSYVEYLSSTQNNLIPIWYESYNALASDIKNYKVSAGVVSDYLINHLISDLLITEMDTPVVRITFGFKQRMPKDTVVKLTKSVDRMMKNPNSEFFTLLNKHGLVSNNDESFSFNIKNQYKILLYFGAFIVLFGGVLLIYLNKKYKIKKEIERINKERDRIFAQEFATLHYFYQNLTVPLIVHKVESNNGSYILMANKAAYELLGNTACNADFDDFVVMGDSDDSVVDYIRTMAVDKSVSYNVRFINDNDYKNKFEFTTKIMPSGDRAFTFIDNYTEEVNMLESLKDSQSALEMATEAGKVGVFEYNAESMIITGNRQFFLNLGSEYIETGIAYGDLLKLMRFDNCNFADNVFDDLVSGDTLLLSAEFVTAGNADAGLWMRLNAKAKSRDSRGVARIIIGVVINIDYIKRTNLKLEGLSRNFELLMDNSHDIIYSKGLDYKFVWASSSIARFVGLSDRSEIIGKDDFDLFDRETAEKFNQTEREVIEQGKSVINHEQSFVTDDGMMKWVLTTKIPIRNANGEIIGLLGMGKDISNYKNVLEAFNSSQRIKSIGKLAGGIAHDFNNSLSGIMGFAHLLQDSFPSDSKEMEYLEYIIKGTQRCSDLTRHLLAYARRGKYIETIVNMHELLATTIEIIEHTISNKVKITLQLAAENCLVKADASQFENALINIIANAEYAVRGEGNIVIETRNVNPELRGNDLDSEKINDAQLLEITITDDGEGISPENIGSIFDPFYTTKKVGEGAGLGLSAVYGIITNHHGKITVSSELGLGSCFTITLPLFAGEKMA